MNKSILEKTRLEYIPKLPKILKTPVYDCNRIHNLPLTKYRV